jgi:hypothetical protein
VHIGLEPVCKKSCMYYNYDYTPSRSMCMRNYTKDDKSDLMLLSVGAGM